ncbi:MAG: GNAT family N-acetyltransferase [Pseudomonadota bacterium]
MTPPTLTTARLTLGPLGPEHFDTMANFYASDRSQYVGGPQESHRTWRTLATEIGHWTLRGYGRFAVSESATGAFVGVIGPWYPEGWPEPEIGWDLMDGFEGRGYATEAAQAARNWAYTHLGWTTAISLVAPANAGSAKVATRLGAHHESDVDHILFGQLQIWRHPAPAEVGP